MTIQATRIGVVTYPTDDRYGRSKRVCPRCGLRRQVNRGEQARLCGSCADEVRDLGEQEVWR